MFLFTTECFQLSIVKNNLAPNKLVYCENCHDTQSHVPSLYFFLSDCDIFRGENFLLKIYKYRKCFMYHFLKVTVFFILGWFKSNRFNERYSHYKLQECKYKHKWQYSWNKWTIKFAPCGWFLLRKEAILNNKWTLFWLVCGLIGHVE